MKLSELSYREYIALEVLPAIVARGEKPSPVQVASAFSIADAFLYAVGKEDARLKAMETRLARAEMTNDVLRESGIDIERADMLLSYHGALKTVDSKSTLKRIADLQARERMLYELHGALYAKNQIEALRTVGRLYQLSPKTGEQPHD